MVSSGPTATPTVSESDVPSTLVPTSQGSLRPSEATSDWPTSSGTSWPSGVPSDSPSVAGSSGPTVTSRPTGGASRLPSPSPSHSANFCDDSDFDYFLVPSLNETHRCVWLVGREAEYKEEVCGTELGMATCPETCEVCSDNCDDTSTKFYIGDDIRDCLWLRLRPHLKSDLCFASSDTALHCPETCDICDGYQAPTEALAPVPAPASPAIPPALSAACDDDKYTTFFVPEIGQFQQCIWLAARPDYKVIHCDPQNPSGAYDICEETCEKCKDNCTDTSGDFQVGTAIRDCLWLSLRPQVQELLCLPGHGANIICPETCDTCDLPAGETFAPTPTPAPVQDSPDLFCDDDKFRTFDVPDLNEFQRCVWLSARPNYIAQLCSVNSTSGAREVCPETCMVCVDDCNDTDGRFDVGADSRDCLWLSLRPMLHETLCTDQAVALACPETCDVCDADPAISE